MNAVIHPLAAWLLTYALHSTLLLGAAWLVCRRLGRRALPAQEILWKAALLGGLLTASLQVGLGTGGWALPAADTVSPAVAATVAPPAPAVENRGALANRSKTPTARQLAIPAAEVPAATVSRETATTIPTASSAEAVPAAETASWPAGLAALWILGALLSCAWLALSYGALARRLRGRSEVTGGAIHQLFTVLSGHAGLSPRARLTASSRAPAPLAQGVVRPEVCVPVRVLSDLTEHQQETLLAHEMGHLARRDPAWLLTARIVESLLFFQPLNRLARKRLQEIAEFRADDWAVTATGRPLDLARCLTRVAGWHLPALPVPAIAEGRSGLGRRVHRLLAARGDAERAPRGLWWAAGAVLALVIAVAPGVTAGSGPAPTTPPEPEAPETLEATARAPRAPRAPGEAPGWTVAPSLRVTAPAPRPAPQASPGPAAPAAPPAPPPPPDMEWMEGFEAGMEEFEAALEEALGPLEELDARMEALTSGFEEEIEALTEHLEYDIDTTLGPRLEELAEKTVHGELSHAEKAEMQALSLEIGQRAQEVTKVTQQLHQRLAPLHEEMSRRLGEELPRLLESSMPDPEALEALTERARVMAERSGRLSDEERRQLAEEARRLAEANRPSEEELHRIREEVRRLTEEAMPSREEMERVREEMRRDLDAARAEHEHAHREREEARRRQQEHREPPRR